MNSRLDGGMFIPRPELCSLGIFFLAMAHASALFSGACQAYESCVPALCPRPLEPNFPRFLAPLSSVPPGRRLSRGAPAIWFVSVWYFLCGMEAANHSGQVLAHTGAGCWLQWGLRRGTIFCAVALEYAPLDRFFHRNHAGVGQFPCSTESLIAFMPQLDSSHFCHWACVVTQQERSMYSFSVCRS